MLYREKYGPFNPTLRNDAAAARIACAMAGGKMRDYMPWPKESEEVATPAKIMAILQASRRN